MTHLSRDPLVVADVLALVTPELRRSTGPTDLRRRLANLGYDFIDTPDGRVLRTLPHRIEIATLPATYLA